jgi:hypothetical protein
MVAADPAIAPARRSFFALLWGMIRRPRSTLAALREQGGRSWLLMAFLAMLVVAALALVAAPIASRVAQEAVRANLESRPGGQEITPEMQAQAARMATNPLFTTVLPIIGGLAGLWVSWLAWAGGLHLASTVLGGSSSFRQMFRAVVWCWLPFTLRRLTQLIYIAASQQVIANPGLSGWMGKASVEEFVASPPGMSSPPGTSELLLRAFLGQVDIFLLWALVLLIIAVLVTARISARKAIIITLVVWLLFSAISLLPALASGVVSSSFSP